MLKKIFCSIMIFIFIFTITFSQELTNKKETLDSSNNKKIKTQITTVVKKALLESKKDADKNESAFKWIFISSMISCLLGTGSSLLLNILFYPVSCISLTEGVGAFCLLTTIGSTLIPSNTL
ncbi:MAG: hypothetical protein QME48_06470 [bacterium]|uniref:Uncharacterized protein n=2 Tax=Bacteria candidate phyla TaxID=1783234 RepID=A0A101I3W9_UNCT6|nr:MAG: hypothetical protein XD76_0130 [candidate division TA06 bacterium 32_111]KUK88054.1 MAG: hypothetical protein XE03_0060 [candidate division TA06 bacterium 34_109]MDI6700860.1 hypothetical protein [bacterium]HAF06986.1 hypothetical protein [candidate division WOR-3 bacterium]HCP16900.1 hypothetical protein [candidate division WOR-3 bacterium]